MLISDGDLFEQTYATQFLNKEFPSYEEFWRKFVVRLTNRPTDINFKSSGIADQDVQISQLHYSVLIHLAGAWEIMKLTQIGRNELGWGFTSLISAQDVATELLARALLHSKVYDPFRRAHSEDARRDWTKSNPWPKDVAEVRTYRNSLSHGHVPPFVLGTNVHFPIGGKESSYRDWRIVTEGRHSQSDFAASKTVLQSAWKVTLEYLENEWTKKLLLDATVSAMQAPQKPHQKGYTTYMIPVSTNPVAYSSAAYNMNISGGTMPPTSGSSTNQSTF